MPAHNKELAPVHPVPEGSGKTMEQILDFLPEKRNRTYDMRHILQCIADRQTTFVPV